MPRQRIAPNTVGPVSVVLMARPVGETTGELPVPDSVYETKAGKRGWRSGDPVAIEIDGALVPCFVTRWRGLVRVADVDGTTHMIRRWTATRASAELLTREAGFQKLAELERARSDVARESSARDAGDLATTVGDLIGQCLQSPGFAKLAPKTQQDYGYAAAYIRTSALARTLPRNVDVAAVRRFMQTYATVHGTGGTKHAQAVLSRAMTIAVETAALRTPFNPVLLARDAIPAIRVRNTGLDHRRAPTDLEVEALLEGLRSDPEAGVMSPGAGRSKSAHGAAGTAPVNGKDIADLVLLMFRTGARVGEVGAMRWSDVDFDLQTVSISGSLTRINGKGTVRQERTKTKGSTRIVPLADDAVAALRARSVLFGIDFEDPDETARPIFGSPQFPERWRDYRNLTRAIKELFTRHGIDYGRGHLGRKWRVTSLIERGIPVHKTADFVGHTDIKTTFGYLGRGRQTDPDVRAAL